ncbi:hypothetical protein [Cohnella algarum]|uniref:hypothetical protein n=1 Tax=Cohnella algarum TaxID=2044859 RepID=UPI001F073272|nr:hypothetical protein [Cohnella algarum]
MLIEVLAHAEKLGFRLQGLTYSPITGGEGNIEFLAYWRLEANASETLETKVLRIPFRRSFARSWTRPRTLFTAKLILARNKQGNICPELPKNGRIE